MNETYISFSTVDGETVLIRSGYSMSLLLTEVRRLIKKRMQEDKQDPLTIISTLLNGVSPDGRYSFGVVYSPPSITD